MRNICFLLATLILMTMASGVCLAQPASEQVVYQPGTNLAAQATVEVSSAAGRPGQKYSLEGINDEQLDTWWASKKDVGVPQWIRLAFDKAHTVDTVVFLQGDNPSLYANSRLLHLSFSDGSTVQQELADHPGPFIIRFPARKVEWVKLDIIEPHEQKAYYTVRELLVFEDPDGKVAVRLSPRQRWLQVDLTETGRPSHPTVYMTPEDVQRAREKIEQSDWARSLADGIIANADTVVDTTPEWIRENCPDKGAAFAYGFTGCPICGARWGSWGGANCSFDRPGTVRCASGHVLPDEAHPDDGTGYKAPDGRIHYFIGSYNAWVVETYQKWADWLSFAYTITGEEKYAETCAVLLDTLAEIYPSCDAGSWDYPSTPPSGRLSRPWYQVARVLVTLVDYYDQIYHSPVLDQPSYVEGLTRRENIETNMLKNGAWYCYEESLRGGLNNGEADYIRGALSVGCLLGIDAYVDWAVNGPYGIYALVQNNADRDGRYYESSLSYALHARRLYFTFAEPLVNYRSERYPEGLNLYDDPTFRSFYVLPRLAMDCAGKWPRYGDSGPDTARTFPDDRPFDATDYSFAERIYNRTSDLQVRRDFGTLVSWLADGDVEKMRGGSSDARWLLFHGKDMPATADAVPEHLLRMVRETTLMGQKGMAILRTPHSTHAQACLLRYGPVLNHGHYDDLNINYFGLGYELTYELGYALGSTHTQVGWGKQTASHQLVLVDEERQLAGEGDYSGGSLHMLAAMPGMQVVDADANGVYRSVGVDTYRRFLALVGDGPNSYLLDIFSVDGGTQHDYIAHSLSEQVVFEGVTLGAAQPGSLAGPDIIWGELQQNDGDVSPTQRPYWVPLPPNGLGFMMHPQRGTAAGPWSATWTLPDGESHMRMTVLPEEGTEVISTWAPGIYPRNPRARHVIARRSSDDGPLSSTFVSVREPYGLVAADPGGIQGAELMAMASTDDGTMKYLDDLRLTLFQAREVGGQIHFDLQVETDDQYYLFISPYMSPNYGAVQFLIDGNPVGEPFVANSADVQPGPLQVLGPLTLNAGEHRLSIKTVEHDGGQPWISVRALNLTTEPTGDAQLESAAFIEKAVRLPSSDGVTALAVEQRSGVTDRFVYAPSSGDATVTTDDLTVQGSFGHVRSSGGAVTAARVVGKSVAAPGFEMQLAHAEHSGSIVRLDYEQNLVYVDADLPTDGRLQYQTIMFSNPAYSRNTAYTIHDITREGDLSVIHLGTQRLVIGQGIVDQDPTNAHELTSLTQHEYANGIGRRGTRFFVGKLLSSADGLTSTRIVNTRFAQPMLFEVESTAGFSEGDQFYYYDLQEGDRFVIRNWATAVMDEGDQVLVTATDDVTITALGTTRTIPWRRP
jgi:hypothetical protein